MALVLKVQPEPKKLDKLKVSPMHDIGFLLVLMSFDGKKAAIRMDRIRMAGNIAMFNLDVKDIYVQIGVNQQFNTSPIKQPCADLP